MMGNAAQSINTVSVSEAFHSLVINNSSGINTGVTLQKPAFVSGIFTLTTGVLNTTSTELLTVTNPAIAAVVGGSINTFVTGPMERWTASIGNYDFPVGKLTGPYSVYRPAIVFPSSSAPSVYNAEYMVGTAPPGLGNRIPISILNTEYWPITRSLGSSDAIVKLDYINPNNDAHWTATGPSGCTNCNVAVVKTFASASNYWHFTDYGGMGGFDTFLPETRFWQNDGLIWSKLINDFDGYNFTFGFDYNTILPLRLLSFNGKLVNEDAHLVWSLADYKDLAGFDLEHSTDGSTFKKIAGINAASTTAYSYIHSRLQPGLHYYRLLVKDKNGRNSYSKTVLLVLGRNITVIKGMKATVVLGAGYVEIWSAINQKAKVQIYDIAGRLLGEQKGTLLQGDNSMRVDLLSLPQGMYNLLVITDDGVKKNLRLMKE
jgi:hypothetical protein